MESTLDSYKKLFISVASGLPNYRAMNETQLANGFCDAYDADDQILSNQYYAALILRYWYKIYKYKETCASARLEDIDYISWLGRALDATFKYRSWRDPKSPMFTDPKGVDKIINRCCASVRLIEYQAYNKDNRKINYLYDSIDSQIEQFGNAAAANVGEEDNEDSPIISAINNYIENNDILSATILDLIAYQDVFKTQKVIENDIKKSFMVFDKRRLTKILINENNSYSNYFLNTYSIDRAVGIAFFDKIKNSPRYLVNKLIDKRLEEMKRYLQEIL